MVTAQASATDYTADKSEIKKGIAHVRARPAMYIGDVYENGLHHLINEVVDNSVDEAMASFCDTIDVTLSEDGSITILDNGRGIPIAIHPSDAATIRPSSISAPIRNRPDRMYGGDSTLRSPP